MIMRDRLYLTLAAMSLAGMIVALPGVAAERSGVSKLYRSALPYWQLGNVNKELSRMCSLGQFNQRVPYRFSAHLKGPNGAAMVGGAKGTGLNLFDPYRKADAKHDYWFYQDRTSACIVMSWPVSPGNGLPVPPPEPGTTTANP